MKISTLTITALALTLVACAPIKSSTEPTTDTSTLASSSSAESMNMNDLYRYYESEELGISFYYPASFLLTQTTINKDIEYADPRIPTTEIFFWIDHDEKSYQIRMMKTRDPKIIQYLATDHPFENIIIAGRKMQKFRQDTMKETVGFIESTGTENIVVSFDFSPDADVMKNIMASLKFL